jgi:hypothetical protein
MEVFNVQAQDDWKPCICPVDFDRVNRVTLAARHLLILRLVPSGIVARSGDYVAANPRRTDRRRCHTIVYPDNSYGLAFDIMTRGGDLIVSHPLRILQRDAAGLIAAILNVEWRAAPDTADTAEGGHLAPTHQERALWARTFQRGVCLGSSWPASDDAGASRERRPDRPVPREAL